MTAADAIIHLRDLIGSQTVAMVATTAPGGEIHSRPMTLLEVDDEGFLWFFVQRDAEWVRGLSTEESLNVSFSADDTKTWTSVAGAASLSHDRAKIDRYWTTEAKAFFPRGQDAESLALLRVDPHTAEYWDAPANVLARLALRARTAVKRSGSELGESGTIDLN